MLTKYKQPPPPPSFRTWEDIKEEYLGGYHRG